MTGTTAENISGMQNLPIYNQLLVLDNILRDNYHSISQPKLMAFTKTRPDLWFIMAEAKFAIHGIIDDKVKYLTVLKALDHDTIEQISDIIRQEPTTDKYKTLKNVIISRLSDYRQNQVKKLLCETTLANKTPSQLLRQMRELADGSADDTILHQLWLERIPAHIKPHLITTSQFPLDTIAEFADRFYELMPYDQQNNQVMATSARYPVSPTLQDIDSKLMEIQKSLITCMMEINELKLQQQNTQQQLQQLTLLKQQNQQLQAQQFPMHHNRSRTRSLTPTCNDICYYHQRFGSEAKRCILPCKFASTTKLTTNQGN
ncbi:uncharacterized protein LOC118446832 [Vespa mandarinia]|uniref:uncharacterized protein LOC118446832 n=1 Tax=Vespa mandarinia TaxID=7446 RepID=UPI00161C9137|nr:uncharacterized protein LOC118446832 [Vespa mandarinia]